jgi:hypothetical protein
MEHQRIGGDPADKLSPQFQSPSPPRAHDMAFGCVPILSRQARHSLQD